MRPSPQVPLLLTPALALLALTACTAPGQAGPEPEVAATASNSPVVEPLASPTLSPRDADAALFVRATATASNGAQLSLELQVHQAYSWDYGGTQTMPAAVVTDCGGSLTEAMIEDGQWSFVRANVSALPVVGTPDWPADEPISLSPDADFAYSSARGMVTADNSSGPSLCTQTKLFSGPGNGAIAVAISGDAALTGWASHAFGFRTGAAVLSDCASEVTDVGRQYGAESGAWGMDLDDKTCVVGAPTEAKEY